LNWL